MRLYLWAVGIATLALTVLMIVLAHPLVQILFQRGKFSAADTRLTSTILAGFLIGFPPMAFGFIVSRAFSALGKTRLLMYVTIFSVFANAIFDYLFARLWQGFGIALATSAVYYCTMFILLVTLRRIIGKLNLLTPPGIVHRVILRIGLRNYTRGRRSGEKIIPRLCVSYGCSLCFCARVLRLSAFAGGIAGKNIIPSIPCVWLSARSSFWLCCATATFCWLPGHSSTFSSHQRCLYSAGAIF